MSPHFLRKYIFALITLLACQSVEATKRSYEEGFQESDQKLDEVQASKKYCLDLEETDDYESLEYPVLMETPDGSELFTPVTFMEAIKAHQQTLLDELEASYPLFLEVPPECRGIILDYCDLRSFINYSAASRDLYEDTRPIIKALISREEGGTDDGRVILPGYDYYRSHYRLFESDVRQFLDKATTPWKNSRNFREKFLLDPKEFLFLARFQLYALMNGKPGEKDFFLDSLMSRWDYPFMNDAHKIGSDITKMYKEVLLSLTGRDLMYVRKECVRFSRMGNQLIRTSNSLPLMRTLFGDVFNDLKRTIIDSEHSHWSMVHALINFRNIIINPVLRDYLEKNIFCTGVTVYAPNECFPNVMRMIRNSIFKTVKKDDELLALIFNAREVGNPKNGFEIDRQIEQFFRVVFTLYSYDDYSFDDLNDFKEFLLSPNVFNRVNYGSNKEHREVFDVGLTKIIEGLQIESSETISEIQKHKETQSFFNDEESEKLSQLEEKSIQERKRIDGFKTARDVMTKKK